MIKCTFSCQHIDVRELKYIYIQYILVLFRNVVWVLFSVNKTVCELFSDWPAILTASAKIGATGCTLIKLGSSNPPVWCVCVSFDHCAQHCPNQPATLFSLKLFHQIWLTKNILPSMSKEDFCGDISSWWSSIITVHHCHHIYDDNDSSRWHEGLF